MEICNGWPQWATVISPDPSFPHAHAVMRVGACACTEGSGSRGATRAEISYALAEINWKSVGNHGNLARNQKSGPSGNQEISEKSQDILEK